MQKKDPRDGNERRETPRVYTPPEPLAFCTYFAVLGGDVCGKTAVGKSEKCDEHQPPAWNGRWSGEKWTDLERSK